LLATWVPSLLHDGWALTVDEVALLKGPDRQKVLEEGAKKEGKILWYSTLIVNQTLRPIKEAFEKKYPFVQVEYYRADCDSARPEDDVNIRRRDSMLMYWTAHQPSC
jgi:hypothetical protein